MWLFIIGAVFTLIAGFVTFLLYDYQRNKKKLSWVDEIPGLPILGVALEFGQTTEYLNTISSFLDRTNGLCWINMASVPLIIASDDTFLEFILATTKVLNKSSEYKFLHNWLGQGLLTADGGPWKKNRKFLTPAFHFSILETFVDVFEHKGSIMAELLEKEVGKDVVDIYPYVTLCSLDIISEAAMGVKINAQTGGQSEYIFAVKEMCRITVVRGFDPMKRFDLTYPLTSDYYKEKRYVNILHSFTESVIESKLKERASNGNANANDGKKKAFLDLMLDFNVQGQTLSDREIRQEVDTFMFEGHDTTASAISFVLYCLAKYPEVQAEAVEEQRGIFEDDPNRHATHRDLQDMKFLDLVIKETLRLYPSVPFYARRTHEDVVYKEGKIIPKNVNIIIYAYGSNRNPKYFKDPEKFDPRRFEEVSTTRAPYSYIPFSAGPRNCIGQKFAVLELKSVVSKILRSYVLESAGPEHEPQLAPETVLKSKNGVNVKLRRREWK